MKLIVIGSSGLIGSGAVTHFDKSVGEVHRLDTNMRQEFLGHKGDTTWNVRRLR